MLASRKIFLGSSTLVTAFALQILGSLTARKAAELMVAGSATDSSNGLTMGIGGLGAWEAHAQKVESLLRVAEVAGAVCLILGTVGVLIVLTGIYQLAILVENGPPRPDKPDSSIT